MNLKDLKKLINEENKTKLIGLLTILITLWLILYFIPELFSSLFNTLLGNLILLIITLITLMYNTRYGIIIGIIFIVLYRFSQLSVERKREGYQNSSIQNFIEIQNSINPQIVFDTNMIQKNQVTQEELDYFNENSMWPWSDKTTKLYEDSIKKNPFIRTYSGDSVNYARKIYNEKAILMILSYQAKEGQFLLNGVSVKDPSGNTSEDLPSGYGSFGYNSGLIDNKSNDIIKCNMKNSYNPKLERITYTGKGGIYGEQTFKTSSINNDDIESIIPGFKFIDSPCNPCVALKPDPDYSCKFKLETKNDTSISKVWQQLWGMD